MLQHELSDRAVAIFIDLWPQYVSNGWDLRNIPDLFGMSWYKNSFSATTQNVDGITLVSLDGANATKPDASASASASAPVSSGVASASASVASGSATAASATGSVKASGSATAKSASASASASAASAVGASSGGDRALSRVTLGVVGGIVGAVGWAWLL